MALVGARHWTSHNGGWFTTQRQTFPMSHWNPIILVLATTPHICVTSKTSAAAGFDARKGGTVEMSSTSGVEVRQGSLGHGEESTDCIAGINRTAVTSIVSFTQSPLVCLYVATVFIIVGKNRGGRVLCGKLNHSRGVCATKCAILLI